MEEKRSPSVRPLYVWEAQEAKKVFGNRLNYERVRIHECNPWPNTINRIGTRLKGMEYVEVHNAITLGNHCFFPVKLLEAPVPYGRPEFNMLGWLIHELTHCWQYQQLGWKYLYMALKAQFRLGAEAYNFGGQEGLLKGLSNGMKLADFNLEQQGDIARSYYERICAGKDVVAWVPYIGEMNQEPLSDMRDYI